MEEEVASPYGSEDELSPGFLAGLYTGVTPCHAAKWGGGAGETVVRPRRLMSALMEGTPPDDGVAETLFAEEFGMLEEEDDGSVFLKASTDLLSRDCHVAPGNLDMFVKSMRDNRGKLKKLPPSEEAQMSPSSCTGGGRILSGPNEEPFGAVPSDFEVEGEV